MLARRQNYSYNYVTVIIFRTLQWRPAGWYLKYKCAHT